MTQEKKPWLVLVVLCGLAAASIGISINTSGVFYSVVSEDLGILRGSFAFNMTIFSLVNAISGLFVTGLLKKIPFKLILSVSVIAAALATGLMGQSSYLWQFYLLGALRGCSTGMFSIMTLTLIINYWFSQKNGLATNIALSFSGITGALMSPVIAGFITHHGWHFAYWMQALFILLFCLPALLFPFTVDPREEGLQAYGNQEKEIEDVTTTEATFKVSGYYLALLLFAISIGFITSMAQHLPGFTDSIGLGVTMGAKLLSLTMIGNIIAKLVVGYLSDKIGAIKACFILVLTTTISVAMFLLLKNPSLLMVAAFLLGSSFGVVAVSAPLLTRHIFGFANYGKAYPMVNFASNCGAALAFSAIGFIYDFSNSYYPALVLFLILLIIASFSLLYASKNPNS